jgi:zinc transport system permease protein
MTAAFAASALAPSLLGIEILDYDFMRRALLAAVLVGVAAPSVGIYLVQRRLSLIGDGLGHVALTGVAVGLVTSWAPLVTALIAAVAGALLVELVRVRGGTGGDVALAVLFYGGIAGGVVIVSQAPAGTTVNLDSYLFGAITTTTIGDLQAFGVLTVVVLAVTVGMRRPLYAVSIDPEHAQASGLPVLGLNLLLAVVTSVTVVVSMRVVGLLLISALMVVPIAAAQVLATSFRSTAAIGATIGVVASVSGVAGSFYADTPSGGTIVLVAIAIFLAALVGSALRNAVRRGARRAPSSGTVG